MRKEIQPIADPTPTMRATIDVTVDLDHVGEVTAFAFDGVREAAAFRFSSPLSMLVMNLRTDASKALQPTHAARLASHPIQFKDSGSGRPIPVPEYIRVRRFGDFCCALEVHAAVVAEERFDFHMVVIVGERLVGSPDPTVVIEPPPCTGPNCEEPPGS